MPVDFDALYEKYAGLVYSRCLSFCEDREDARDLVHDVFLQALKGYKGFRNQSDIYTWIYRITTNVCLNYLKKHRRIKASEIPVQIDLSDHSKHVAEIERTLFLNFIFESLNRKSRRIVFLIFFEGLTQEETAELLNVSRKTVSRTLKAIGRKLAGLENSDAR